MTTTTGGLQTYFSLCGVELWNQARLQAYMDNGLGPSGARLRSKGCEALPDVIPCEDHRPTQPFGYSLPELDGASWYDPSVPESKNFAGLLVTEVTMSAPVDRRLIQNIGHGAVLSRVRHPGRTIEVKGVLVGKTCCAVRYGQVWLTQALLGNLCDCSGCDAHFLTCCPEVSGEDDCLVVDGATYVRPAGQTEFQRASDFVRNMHGVGLLDGPDVTKCLTLGCGTCGCGSLTEVEFTLATGVPWMFMEPEAVVEGMVLGACDPGVCTVEWSKDPSCPSVVNCDPPDCLADPLYPPPPDPPRSLAPLVGGVCIPLSQERVCVELNPTNRREWSDSTLTFEISSGSEELRSLFIRLFANPTGLPCCGDPFPDDCTACGSLYVKYIPPGATLRIDGQRRRITMTCLGVAEVDASGEVYSADGRGFEWPEVSCTPFCIAFDKDCFNTSADATVSVYQIFREL